MYFHTSDNSKKMPYRLPSGVVLEHLKQSANVEPYWPTATQNNIAFGDAMTENEEEFSQQCQQ